VQISLNSSQINGGVKSCVDHDPVGLGANCAAAIRDELIEFNIIVVPVDEQR
jgi:hypothetical protein